MAKSLQERIAGDASPFRDKDTGWLSENHFFWIEIPGESDDQCTRGLGPAGTTVDPEWGRIDPSAGKWFAEMALELADNVNVPTVITP